MVWTYEALSGMQEADLVLGGDEGKECTYREGYKKRQAVFACRTCTPDGNAGFCTACSLSCHEGHDVCYIPLVLLVAHVLCKLQLVSHWLWWAWINVGHLSSGLSFPKGNITSFHNWDLLLCTSSFELLKVTEYVSDSHYCFISLSLLSMYLRVGSPRFPGWWCLVESVIYIT